MQRCLQNLEGNERVNDHETGREVKAMARIALDIENKIFAVYVPCRPHLTAMFVKDYLENKPS